MSARTIRRGDTVIAIAGREAGGKKTGKVLRVYSAKGRVLVEGLNLVKKSLRKSQEHPQGKLIDKESPLHVSNVMLFCPKDRKGVRIRRVRVEKRTHRQCRLCGHDFDR